MCVDPSKSNIAGNVDWTDGLAVHVVVRASAAAQDSDYYEKYQPYCHCVIVMS